MTKQFPSIKWRYHEWIEYLDGSGKHAAEPDLFAVVDEAVLLIEFKLTGSAYGKAQCLGLYAPLLRHIFSLPVYSLQICKSLTAETPGPFQDLAAFINQPGEYATWHWIGR